MIEIKKPTTFTEGALLLWTNEAYCYDQSGTGGDETTFGYQSLDTDEAPSIRFHTWETKGQTYTATVLKLKWKTSIQTGDDEFGIEYTKNGGGQWGDLVTKGANRSSSYTTAEIALDTNQDLTQVEIRVNSDKIKGGDGCDLQISDIWTEGTYTEGGVTVDVNWLVSKVVMLAVTVLTSATILVGQLTAKVIPFSPEVKTGQTVAVNLQIAKVIPYSSIIKTGATVETNLLINKIVPYSVTVEVGGGVVVEVNLLNTKSIPYPITVKSSANIPVNLLTNNIVPINPVVTGGASISTNLLTNNIISISPIVSGGANVQVNQLIAKLVPHSVTVDIGGGVNILVNQLISEVIPYPVDVIAEYGVTVPANLITNKLIPYPVTVPILIKSVKGIVSETLRINGFISMDKDYIAPKGIVSNSFIIKGIMQLQ